MVSFGHIVLSQLASSIYLTHMAHDNWFQYEFIWWYAYFSLKKIIKINYLTSYLSFAEDVFCIFINSNELRYLFVFLLTQMNIFNVLNNLTTYNFPSSLWVSKTNHNSQPHGILGNTKKNICEPNLFEMCFRTQSRFFFSWQLKDIIYCKLYFLEELIMIKSV